MVKDDFFVLAYRILTYLYACMKSGELPDEDVISPERLGISQRYWNSIVGNLWKAGYIEGIRPFSPIGGETVYVPVDMAITMTGIEYLQSNSTMEKAKTFLKDLKEIIPGF